MAFRHRKLLDESIPTICQTFCSDPQISNTTCPVTCSKYCPDSCESSIFPQFPPPSPPPPPSAAVDSGGAPAGGLSHALTISLAVLATAFFLFTCYTIYKFYALWKASRRRRIQSQRRDFDEFDGDLVDEEVVDHPIWYIRTMGLQPAVISAIAVVKYKRGDGVVEGTDCAVCLSEFEEEETVRLLPKCSHAFHIPCIDTWLASHTNCPLCRAGIVAGGGGAIQLREEPIGVDSRRSDELDRSEGLGLGFGGGIEIESEIGGNVEGDCKIDVELGAAVQPVRRSVSMDALSASAISAAVANAFPRQCDDKSSGDRLGKVGK